MFSFVVPLSIINTFFLLFTSFSSMKDALVVMTDVSFILIRGAVALWFEGCF